MRKLPILTMLLLSGGWTMSSSAETDHAGAFEVVEKVEQAIDLLRADEELALTVLRDPDSDFVWKDTYVFVLDCDADRVVANPVFPELVGGDVKQHGDFAGYPYGLDLCRTADAPGGGWVEYFWVPPGQEKPVRKLSYIRSAMGTTYQVAAGVYDYSMTEPRQYYEFSDGP